jgi:uncharacterized repeat protein (TIGR02543 family)
MNNNEVEELVPSAIASQAIQNNNQKTSGGSKTVFVIIVLLALFAFGAGLYWFMINKQYKVSFDAQNGSGVVIRKVKKGDTVQLINDPIKNGFIFVEWQYNGSKFDSSMPINQDITVIAKWEEVNNNDGEQFIVSFDSGNEEEISSQTIESGNTARKPNDPVRETYVFAGWYLNDQEYDFNTPVTANITLVAKWEKEEAKKYTITFDSDGGSKIKNQSILADGQVKKPTNPKKSGYIFIEWQLDGMSYDFSMPVTSDITLTAVWEEQITYKVTFDSNGGSKVSTQTINLEAKAKKPSTPTRSGYKFIEWQLEGGTYDFNTPITSDITLIAKWEKEETVQYTVTFDSNGGSKVVNKLVGSGEKVTKPTNPIKSGYKFIAWLLNDKEYDFNTPVTGNITLVAKWEQNSYTLKAVAPDQYSPNRTLHLYDGDKEITFYKIYYGSDGVLLCDGASPNVDVSALDETVYLVQLTANGSKSKAILEK